MWSTGFHNIIYVLENKHFSRFFVPDLLETKTKLISKSYAFLVMSSVAIAAFVAS